MVTTRAYDIIVIIIIIVRTYVADHLLHTCSHAYSYYYSNVNITIIHVFSHLHVSGRPVLTAYLHYGHCRPFVFPCVMCVVRVCVI